MPVPFPIPYQGSKRKLAPAILRCFPEGAGALYEPFCGSAAVTIAALAEGRIARAALNDSNEALIDLWSAIVHSPEDLSAEYRDLWNKQLGRERTFYDHVRAQFNRQPRPGLFLYLLARCVKAAVRYNANGEFNQSPDNRRLGARPERMREHIFAASSLLRDAVSLTSMDYEAALTEVTSDDLVYMDPPYQGVSTNRDRRYRDVLGYEEFAAALERLNQRDISYIISYDGRTGSKLHGKPLPESLQLVHLEIDAGRSTQATFLGTKDRTVESLYLSPALIDRLGKEPRFLGQSEEVVPILLG